MAPRSAAGLHAVVIALLLPSAVHAQGLARTPDASAGASESAKRLTALYNSSRAWRAEFGDRPNSTCSRSSGSLCASQPSVGDAAVKLQLATSPQAYDARALAHTGGFSAIGPVKAQGECATCVAFAVLAAAQTAVATALREDASSQLSEQDFYFCKSARPNEDRSCSGAWTMKESVEKLVDLTNSSQYPVLERCLPYSLTSTEDRCGAAVCSDTLPSLKKGSFRFQKLGTPWEVQEWIRLHGSAVTRLEVYSDFRDFFQRNASGVYPSPGKNATFVESHAVQVVGYDLPGNFFIAKNSWGLDFANGGFFRVAIGAAGMGAPEDTYGLRFEPYGNVPDPSDANRTTPSAKRKGCFYYRAAPSDFVSRVALKFTMNVTTLLLDNLATITKPDMWLDGLTLLVCPPGAATANAKDPQLDALLQIKAAVDQDNVLKSWSKGSEQSFCLWPGISCNSAGNVREVNLGSTGLRGSLPGASALQGLPSLATLRLHDNKLEGTLPREYGDLKRLVELSAWRNPISGPIPPEWSGMASLEQLDLGETQVGGVLPDAWSALRNATRLIIHSSKLNGTLPASWSALAKLKQLRLDNNALTGPLPPSFAELRSIQEMRLGDNKLSGPLPEWDQLEDLSMLNLQNNLLEGALPSSWTGMANLKWLDISNNALTGSVPPEYGTGLESIEAISLFDNPGLNGCVPLEWKDGVAKGRSFWRGTKITGFCPK